MIYPHERCCPPCYKLSRDQSSPTIMFTRSMFYKRQPIRGTFSEYFNLPEKLRSNTSLPREIKGQCFSFELTRLNLVAILGRLKDGGQQIMS